MTEEDSSSATCVFTPEDWREATEMKEEDLEEDLEEDFYAVLGIEGGGLDVSQLDVREAYLTRVLDWADNQVRKVDRTPADVAAAELEFRKIEVAHEVLRDEKIKKLYDQLWTLRKSRLELEKQLSSKRQKLQDLRDQERDHERAYETERAHRRAQIRDIRAQIGAIETRRWRFRPRGGG